VKYVPWSLPAIERRGGVVARSRRPVNFSIFFLYLYLYTQHMCMGERVSHSSSLIYPSYQEE
jgi:hypothetical protein